MERLISMVFIAVMVAESHNIAFDRLPDINEQSILASGPFIKEAEKNDLIQIIPNGILKTHKNNSMFATQKCVNRLGKLVNILERQWNDTYVLKIFRSFLNGKSLSLSRHSLHYEGRALDVAVRRRNETKATLKCWTRTKTYKDVSRNLGWMAYKKAGFNFVSITTGPHGEHVHISCRR